jgi:ABC-type Fe3+-siderophore transport system permease subunit
MKRRNMKPPKPPKAVRRASWRTRVARLLGLALCAAGFGAIALGWAGAARNTCVDCQIPYLISGGAAGVALMILGTGLLLMAQVRTEARRLSAAVDHMTWTLADRFMAGSSGAIEGGPVPPAATATNRP